MQTGNLTISPVNMTDRQKIDVRAGDTVRVWQKVEEKGKTRLQPFEGVVLAHKHGNEAGATFTVRRVSGGYGVEKIFPLYSPMIDKIEIVKRAKVRRAKLYHIREKAAREIRRQMRNLRLVNLSTESTLEAKSEPGESGEPENKETEDTSRETPVDKKDEKPEVKSPSPEDLKEREKTNPKSPSSDRASEKE